MALPQFSKRFREFFLSGIDWVMAAGKKAQGVNAFSYTATGSPQALLFASYSLPNMADIAYQVLTGGETAAVTKVDESTKTAAGFSVLGAGAGEVVHVVVVGRFEKMPAE
jgi:hypothetical protein